MSSTKVPESHSALLLHLHVVVEHLPEQQLKGAKKFSNQQSMKLLQEHASIGEHYFVSGQQIN